MNSLFNRLKYFFTHGRKMKRMMLSIVILAEVIILLVVATYAWVETVSSIKITNEANTKGTVDTYVFTEAMIGEGRGTIDIAKYFKQSGDMHLAPASSADGRTMYFPKANISSNFIYRKGTVSDKNTAYMSVTFKVRADTNADFFFDKGTNDQGPSFSALEDDIRVSVTSQSEGSTSAPVTTIYSKNASTTAVVNSTSGATGATTVEKYADHIKGKSSTARLFAVGANETKIVTINIWLQKKTDADTDLTSNMSQAVTINNFGITSSLTPRHVTLIPTSRWDTGGTAYYYAWCWMTDNSIPSSLYKLGLDENEHYSFDYNGKYNNALFFKSSRDDLTTANMSSNWNSTTIAFKSVDTVIPDNPVDPTFVIDELRGGSYDSDINANKSTGVWANPDIVTIKTAYVNGQTSSMGNLKSTTYIGTTTSTNVVEESNSTNQNALHHNTIHALPGMKVKLKATAEANYRFAGWYSDAEETTLVSANAEYSFDASAEAPVEQTYYAKFMKTHTTSIYVTPRVNWGNNYYIRLYQGSGNNVIDSNNGFVQATYDSNTGYYKANFTTTKTGTFYAILAKDTNHTDKVPSEGGYTGTLGTSYVFKHNQSHSELTEYDSQRCIWFIDGTTNHFIGDNSAKMRIDNWSATYDMRSIGNYCYIYEYTTGTDFSNASGITFKRTSSDNVEWNYWNTSPTSGKSQYTATGTGNDNGSWTN